MDNFSYLALIISIISPFVVLFINERIKGNVKHDFETRIESLRKENQLDIARFEMQLETIRLKDNFKFTKLHEKRFEVLEELYKHVNELYYCLHNFTYPIKNSKEGDIDPDDEWAKAFDKAYSDFFTYYSQKKIYFDLELEKLCDEFIRKVGQISIKYREYPFLKKHGVTGPDLAAASFKSYTSYKDIPAELLPIKERIEMKCRAVLEN